MNCKIFAILFLLLIFCKPSYIHSQINEFYFVNAVRTRAIAMGGAFTSVEDDITAANYNPASFYLYQNKKKSRITFFINPLTTIVSAFKYKQRFKESDDRFDNILSATSSLIKSITLSKGALEFGLILGDPGLTLPKSLIPKKPLSISGFNENHSHTFISSLKLAEKVSIGARLSYLTGSKADTTSLVHRDYAVGYGILLKPSTRLNVGVSYVDLPDSLKRFSSKLERIADEAINVGISYKLFDGTLISVDVRNLAEESDVATREVHAGLEQVFFSQIALRTGYFRIPNDADTFSAGIGLLDWNSMIHPEKVFDHRNFLVNYALVYERDEELESFKHFLSLSLRF